MGNICCASLDNATDMPFNGYVILSPRNTWRPNPPEKKRYISPKRSRKSNYSLKRENLNRI